MNITDKLRLELLIREQITKHGEDFYLELERILSKIVSEEQQVPPTGRARMRVV
jgi:hypothetical protein